VRAYQNRHPTAHLTQMNTFDGDHVTRTRTRKGIPGGGCGERVGDGVVASGMVTETCPRSGGSGFHQIGVFFSCVGSGTNMFTAAYFTCRGTAPRDGKPPATPNTLMR
jgi:hypothetical protein